MAFYMCTGIERDTNGMKAIETDYHVFCKECETNLVGFLIFC